MLELDFAKKAEQISAAFSGSDISSQKTVTGDELNGVQHQRLVSNMDIDFADNQITRHFTDEEMALLEGVDASKRKEAIMRMMMMMMALLEGVDASKRKEAIM